MFFVVFGGFAFAFAAFVGFFPQLVYPLIPGANVRAIPLLFAAFDIPLVVLVGQNPCQAAVGRDQSMACP